MSDKPKIKRADALTVAGEIVNWLGDSCERIAIAGSLRRQKSLVSDIEILYIPKISERAAGLFDKENFSVADELIEAFLSNGYFVKRPSVTNIFTWGKQNKFAIHTRTGIPVDLFSTTEKRWWVSLVIRTGSKETNLDLTSGAIKRGGSLNAYGEGVTWKDATTTPATSEEDVFRLCGVLYKQPEDR